MAALAIPFLIVDSPSAAEGVETGGDDTSGVSLPELASVEDIVPEETAQPAGVEFVVETETMSPDLTRLSAQATDWATARSAAVEAGIVDDSPRLPPSNTNLSLLPVVNTAAPEPEPVEDDSVDEEPIDEAPVETEEPANDPSEEPAEGTWEGTAGETTEEGPGEPVDEPGGEEPVEEDPAEEGVEEPQPSPPEEPPTSDAPATPPQVNGRVPVPAGGPTGAQWDALRKCESTHNYQAISPSGAYRGAYQFSQQTWDWVSGIHWPHLVGIDPIDAEPAWQDVMAYTLYAMRGWDQWPICGKHLL